jgi:hypothetical protein
MLPLALSNWFLFSVDADTSSNIDTRIRHLAEGKTTALEHAHAAAGAAAVQQGATKLLGCKIPEGRSLERYEHRTHLGL